MTLNKNTVENVIVEKCERIGCNNNYFDYLVFVSRETNQTAKWCVKCVNKYPILGTASECRCEFPNLIYSASYGYKQCQDCYGISFR